MRPTIALTLSAMIATTGCARVADSRLNPFNWFNRGAVTAPVDSAGAIKPLVAPEARNREIDGRVLVSTVTGLDIARTPNGGIVRATGTAPTGAFNAQLVPVAQNGGTLTLAFRVEQGPGNGGAQRITAATLLDNADLAGVRRVIVQAQQNSASSSR